jgi:hypothetical protein
MALGVACKFFQSLDTGTRPLFYSIDIPEWHKHSSAKVAPWAESFNILSLQRFADSPLWACKLDS